MSNDADPKRALVQRAVAAAERAQPALERRVAALPELAAAAAQAIAAARAWLDRGEPVVDAALDAAATVRKALNRAWLAWSEGILKDLLNDKRALHAAETAMLAAEAAAWTTARARLGWEHDDAELRARLAAGPELETTEAEQCARLALGTTAT